MESRTVYLCRRGIVGGIAVSNDTGPTEMNIIGANLLIEECNNTETPIVPGERRKTFGPCPADCELNNLANQGFSGGHKESF